VATDPLKILMIAPTPYFSDRGCHVRILEEARALRDLGHAVHICTYHLGRDMAGIPTSRTPAVPWYRKESAGPSWHKPYLDLLLFFKAWQVARHFRPDTLHAHLHEGAFLGFFLKKLLRIPLVFDCQGSLTAELVDHAFVKKGSLLFRLFYSLERRINSGADHIVTSSTPTAQLLLDHFALPSARVTPVVDGVDADDFRPGLDGASLRRELALPEGKRLVVYLGAMSEYQGVDLLLESIQILTAGRDDLHFLLMGYPEEGYRTKAAALGMAGTVTFTGRIDYGRAARYLCLGEIAVSPKLARTEANGKLFNYMACALPTVVFDTPVNREILGETGVYAAYGDAQNLALQIGAILDDPARLQALSLAVRQKAVREYSWGARGEELAAVFRKIRQGLDE
jgi:glycosyltransferase involved in cell wall biosynthesis